MISSTVAINAVNSSVLCHLFDKYCFESQLECFESSIEFLAEFHKRYDRYTSRVHFLDDNEKSVVGLWSRFLFNPNEQSLKLVILGRISI